MPTFFSCARSSLTLLPQAVSGANAVPLLLTTLHYNAIGLAAVCRHWIAMELPIAKADAQYAELSSMDQARAEAEYARLCEARAEQQKSAALLAHLPTLSGRDRFT